MWIGSERSVWRRGGVAGDGKISLGVSSELDG